jgi:uncharacterized protein (TIRG00374 family)
VKRLLNLGVGFVLFGILVYVGGTESLYQIKQIPLSSLTVFFLTTVSITACISVRWGVLTEALSGNQGISWLDYYHYFITSRALSFIIPQTAADGSRALWLLQNKQMTIAHAGLSFVLDRLCDLGISFLFLLVVLPYWLHWVTPSTTFFLMAGISLIPIPLIIFGYGWGFHHIVKLEGILLRIGQRLPKVREHMPESLQLDSLGRRVLLQAYLLSVIKFCLLALRLVFLGQILAPPIPPTPIILGTPLAQLSIVFAFTPGALGIFDASWFAILSLSKVPKDTITALLLEQRVLTFLSILVLTLLSQVRYAMAQAGKKD